MAQRLPKYATGTGDNHRSPLGYRGEAPVSQAIWCSLEDTDHIFYFQNFSKTKHIYIQEQQFKLLSFIVLLVGIALPKFY